MAINVKRYTIQIFYFYIIIVNNIIMLSTISKLDRTLPTVCPVAYTRTPEISTYFNISE